MTQHFRGFEIPDFIVLTICQTVQIARDLLGAQEYVLQLAAKMDWARSRLMAADIAVADLCFTPEGLGDYAEIRPGLHNIPLPMGSPTDLLDIGIQILGADQTPLALLRLEKVQAGWATRQRLSGLGHVMSLLNAQFAALSQGPAIVATPMLRLVTLLRDVDAQAVSHGLSGFLRVLAGEQPSRVEIMAMQIGGLAESAIPCLQNCDVALSETAQLLLDQAGIGRTVHPVEITLNPGGDLAAPVLPSPESLSPFARVRIVEQNFDVAEADASERLWFRPSEAAGRWLPLANGTADGWTAIAAEILAETRDITHDYAQMHLIRRRDLPTDEIAEAYELAGVIWWLRSAEAGAEARLEGGAWKRCNLQAEHPAKSRALEALSQLDADIVCRLSDQARDWAHRMAHAVQVTPYMGVAAE